MRKFCFCGRRPGCLLLLLFVLVPGASTSRAQFLRTNNSSPSSKPGSGATVSVRGLSIPAKAREDYLRGLRSLEDNKVAASIAFFEKAIKQYADYYEAYYHLGVAQARLGLNDRAIASFQSSIDLSGGSYAMPEFAYALLLCQKGQPAEAERIARYGLELEQYKPFGKIVLGSVLVNLNRFEEASQNARDALREDPNAADAYLILASVDDAKREYSQEVRDLDAFLRIDHASPRQQQIRDIRKVAERLAEHAADKHPQLTH